MIEQYIYTMHNGDPYENEKGNEKWNEGMNGTVVYIPRSLSYYVTLWFVEYVFITCALGTILYVN